MVAQLSAACPSQLGNLAITSVIFAAVIWDADEPCSAETAWAPESSFTMSPQEHDSAFVLLIFGSRSAFWRREVHQCSKVDFLVVSLCFQDNILFCSWLFTNSVLGLSQPFPFLVHGSLCIWNFHRLWHGNKLVHQIVMCHRSKSFSCCERVVLGKGAKVLIS